MKEHEARGKTAQRSTNWKAKFEGMSGGGHGGLDAVA